MSLSGTYSERNLNPNSKVARIMAEKLPAEQCYRTRKEAMEAITLAAIYVGGHGFMVAETGIVKRRVMCYCPSLFKLPDFEEKGKCVNILHGGLEGFECTRGENESKWHSTNVVFLRRRSMQNGKDSAN